MVQHQFKGTGQRPLPLAVVGPNEFFFTVTYSPVGVNVNGLGTYALHKDANEYLAYVYIHLGLVLLVEALYQRLPCPLVKQKEHYSG